MFRKGNPVLSTDRQEFDTLMATLCAAYNTPPTAARKDSYWRAFGKQTLVEFAHLVDQALEYEDFDGMPTVPQLRKLKYRRPAGLVVAQQAKDERDTLQRFGNRMLLKLIVLSLGLGSTGKFVPGHGIVNAQPSALLSALREELQAIIEWFRHGVAEEDDAATPKYFVDLVHRAFCRHTKISDAVMAEWMKFCTEPEGSLPFPAYMVRDMKAASPQLEFGS